MRMFHKACTPTTAPLRSDSAVTALQMSRQVLSQLGQRSLQHQLQPMVSSKPKVGNETEEGIPCVWL